MHVPIPAAQLIRSPLDRYVTASGTASTLEAVVLLAGIVRQAPIDRASRRSRLDLPLRTDRTLGQTWRERVAGLRRTLGRPSLRLIVSSNVTAGSPAGAETWEHATLQVDREIRGSGGQMIAKHFNGLVVKLFCFSMLAEAVHMVSLKAKGSSLIQNIFGLTADARLER